MIKFCKNSKSFLLLLSICLLCGCSTLKNKNTKSKPTSSQVAPSQVTSSSQVDNSNEIKNKEKEPEFQAKYTGLPVNEESYNRIPFMAVIENSVPSRPQSGLSYVDIVYETMAEGGITRFVALFQSESCEKIGPIRSVRPYLLDLAKEYNLPIAHCGGSEEALNRIKKGNDMNINEMYHSSFFSRDNTRVAPHNLYTSSENIIKYCNEKNYIKENNIKFNFDDEYWENQSLQEAKSVTLKFNKYYSTNYSFDGKNYIKSMDGVKSIDQFNNKPLTANNIVIQVTDIIPTNDKLHHVKINLIGSGDGYIISNGKYEEITWSKKDLTSQTLLKDNNGNIIPLSKGKTYWHIVDNSCIIDID